MSLFDPDLDLDSDPSSALCSVLHFLCLSTTTSPCRISSSQPWLTLPCCGVGPRPRLRRRPNCVTAAVPVPHPRSSAPRRSQPAHAAPSVAQPVTTSPQSVLAANNHPTPSIRPIPHPTSIPLMLLTPFPGPPRCRAPLQRPRLHPPLSHNPSPTETAYCPPRQTSFMDSSTHPCFLTSIP
jgi:hypothetical protein